MNIANAIQEQRLITPELIISETSALSVTDYFDQFLIEEHGKEGGSFVQFIEGCNREVVRSAKYANH